MTCIVGLVSEADGKVFLGADTRVMDGWGYAESAMSKISRFPGMLIGSTGSIRLSQIVRQTEFPPAGKQEPVDYIVEVVAQKLRDALKRHGLATVDNNAESYEGNLLVAYAGKLFRISADYGVSQLARGYDAVGAGQDYALGALAALGKEAPRVRVQKALEISTLLDASCGAPFHILELEAENGER